MAMGFAVVAAAEVGRRWRADVTRSSRPSARGSARPASSSTSTPWSTCGAADASGPPRRCSGRPSRSSRSSPSAAGASCRSRRSARRRAPWPASRRWSLEQVDEGRHVVDIAVHHLDAAGARRADRGASCGPASRARPRCSSSSSGPSSERTSGPAPSPSRSRRAPASRCPRPRRPARSPGRERRHASLAWAGGVRRRLPPRLAQPGDDDRPPARQGPRRPPGRATRARPTPAASSAASGASSSASSTSSRDSSRPSSRVTSSARTRHTPSASPRCSATSGRPSSRGAVARVWPRRSGRSSACTPGSRSSRRVFAVAVLLTRWVAAGSIFGALAMIVIAVLVWTGHAPGDVWTGLWLMASGCSSSRGTRTTSSAGGASATFPERRCPTSTAASHESRGQSAANRVPRRPAASTFGASTRGHRDDPEGRRARS